MKKILTDIYRCSKREGLYLYVPAETALDALPEALLAGLGKIDFSMKILLTETRKLARADITDVLNSLDENGYYLQLPPVAEAPSRTHA